MILNGTFILREVAGETLVIPVGESALEINGMIVLNPVSKVIWECLERGADVETILSAVMEVFDVPENQAREDIMSFLSILQNNNLVKEG